MAQLSSQFASISPGVNTENATDYLVSAMKAFGKTEEDVERSIMDNVNAIGNTMATTNGEIGEMLERSSAAMAAANNTIEQTIALESAAVEVTRNAETTGTAFRTISMRIRGYNEESEDGAEELDENLKNISGDIADLTKVNGKGGISIFTDKDKTEYKSTYQILKEISEIWDDLTDKQQADLLEKLGGKRGAQSLAHILDDFDSVEEALKTMEDAAGSADREMGIIQDSIEYKINAFKQTWVGVLQDTLDRGEFGNIVDNLTSVSEGIGGIISKLGLLKTAIIGIGTVVGSQKLNLFNYNKNNGGLLFNGSPLKNFKTNLNGEKILGQSENYKFLETIETTGIQTASMIDKIANTYAAAGDKIHPAVVQFAKDWSNVDDEIKETTSMTEYFVSQNTTMLQNLGSKAKDVFGKIGSTLLNGLFSAGISLVVSEIVSKISDLLTYYDDLKKETKNLVNEFETQSDSLHKNIQSYNDLSERYVELSKGVNSLGKNVSLTTDEYDEYKNVVDQLVSLNPNLLQGYNDQGDAILTIKDNVDALTESYNKNIIAANNTIIKGKDKIGENYAVNMNSYGDVDIQNDYDKLQASKAIDEILTMPSIDEESVQAILDRYGNDVTTLILDTLKEADYTYDSYETTAQLIARASKDEIGKSALEASLSEYEATINEYTSGLNDFSKAFVENAVINSDLDNEIQTIIMNSVSDKDADYFNQFINEDNTFDFNALERDLLKVTNAFKNLSPEQLDEIKLGVNLSTEWNNDQLPYDEYVEKVTSFVNLLNTLFPDNKELVESIKVLFDIPDEDELKNKQDIFVNRLGEKRISPNGEMYGVPPEVAEKLKAQGNEVADAWYDSLTKSEREFVDNVSDEDLAKAVKFESTAEFDAWLEELQTIADAKPIEVRTNAGAAEELDSMKTAFDDLSTAYMSSVKNEDSSGNATNNIASAADIQGVNDAFGGVTEITADTELADINALSNALEVYDSALIENKGDAAAAQKAADQLATAYVDLSDVLDDLTEENKEYYIEQLKASGITNAEKVVNTRLSKQYQKTREALENLSKSIAQNRKYLDAGVEAGSDYDDAIANIQSDVQALLAVYDDAGNKIDNLSPEIDTQFIKDNLADIEAATEGDIDALDRLRLAVARINAAKAYIDIDLPADVVSAQLDNLMDKVAQVDAMDIEVGASVDDTAFIGSLQNMINSGQTTADAVSAAFESMGYNVEFTHKTATVELVKYVEEHGANGMPSYVPQKMKEQLSVPEMKITRVSKSSGAKVSNYNGGSSSNSSGSGGGGSDGGSEDSSDETFDWIEVKIERLQEQLEDLGKVADNVYDKWGTRNQAVADQIKTLTEEIQLQKDAAQGYLDKANSIDLSEEYKKKVREGKIEIETVTDQTTIDNINDYTDYWNKYKDAMSTVKELSITRSEYQQTLFDNISAEYEDAITNIEKTVDILNEQITRTEEFGFFVDEQYYNSLLDQEKQNYSKLENERNELINKLNEGIEKGYIEPYSEAWNDMYQSIMDVNIAMEESATNTRKLNNEIRQLKWDKFDWVEEQMSDYATEADFLIKLLQGENNYEDDGNFNNRGFAQAALVGAKYNDTLAKMERYKKAIAEIDEKMADDPTKAADKEMIARKQALVDEYRNSIEAAEDEKQAMQSLVQEGINKHLEALQELINKYKESLDAEKDLYDWQKNVADQTKNIVELEKQLAAYEGDTSEEARKKRQELQSQLNSAQQSLEESQWDRYISETGELLDNMYGDYEDYLNGKLEEVKVLMDSMIGYINDNTTAVKNGIDEVKKEYGLTTQNFEGFAEGQTKLLNEWQDGKFVGDIAAVRTSLSNFYDTYVKISEKNTKDIIDTIGKVVVTDSEKGKVGVQEPKPANGNGTTSGGDPNKPGGTDTGKGLKDEHIQSNGWYKKEGLWHYRDGNGNDLTDTWKNDDGYWYYFDPGGVMLQDQFVEGYWLDDDGHMMPDKFSWHGDDSNGWWFGTDDEQQYVKGESVYIDGKWYDFDENGWLKYATGSRSIPHNQLAWTQDEGQELIYRTTDGALLTPLGQGDMVFTNDMTQRLWEIASGANPFSETVASPSISSVMAQTVNNDNKLTVVLPNVESYEDFKRQMKADTNVQQWMQEVTIGQMMGNNKLNKNKY